MINRKTNIDFDLNL